MTLFFRNLMANKGPFSEFLLQYIQQHQDDEELAEITDIIEDEELKKIIQRQVSAQSSPEKE